MPTAVSTESSENTMSSRTIWTSTLRIEADGASAATWWAGSPSSDSLISVVAFQSRKTPPPMRMRSRHENSLPLNVNTGAVRPTIHEIVSSSAMRMPIARPSPMYRARSRESAGRRWTRIEMKMMLSMPSTISSTVRVMRATQISGFVSSSIYRGYRGSAEGRRTMARP